MRVEEAALIRDLLARPELAAVACVVELGSSDTLFREVSQPHIARNIHQPLASRGVRVVTTDIKSGEGIEVVGDIFDRSIQETLKTLHPDAVLCCNIFEHVEDRRSFAAACDSLLAPGGFMLVTVPYSYPYHLDPIDTMYRPTPDQILQLFPGYRMVVGKIFEAGSYVGDIRKHGSTIPMQLLRSLGRGLWPWRGLDALKARLHRWLWLGRPFKMSIALMQKGD